MWFQGKHGDATALWFLKGALAHLCTVVFCVNVSDTLIAVSNASCFCWHQKAEAVELIVWLGNTRHTHMGPSIWR